MISYTRLLLPVRLATNRACALMAEAARKRHMLTFVAVLAFCSLCAFDFSCALRKKALGGVRTGSNDAKLLPLPVDVAVGADWRRAFFLLPLFVFLDPALASSSDDDSMRCGDAAVLVNAAAADAFSANQSLN